MKINNLESLKKSQEQLDTIFSSLKDTVFVISEDYKILFKNESAHDIFGGELVGKNCYDIIKGTNQPCEKCPMVILSEKDVYQVRIEQCVDSPLLDEIKYFDIIITVIENYDGKKACVEVLRDITERKKAEKKLKKYQDKLEELVDERTDALVISEKKFQNIIENTQDVIIIVGFDGKIKFISPQISTILGVEEVKTGAEFLSYIHLDDRDYIINLFQKAVKQKHSSKDNVVELRALHRDGYYLWLSSSTKNYYDNDGNVIGFISSLRDITNRKIAEQKLRESEVKFRNLVENISDAIIETEIGGKFKYASPQIYDIFGYTSDEVIGLKSAKNIHPDDFERFVKAFKRAIRSGEKISIEYRSRHKDGHYVPVSLRGHIFKDKKNYKLIGLIGDITKKKNSRAKIKRK